MRGFGRYNAGFSFGQPVQPTTVEFGGFRGFGIPDRTFNPFSESLSDLLDDNPELAEALEAVQTAKADLQEAFQDYRSGLITSEDLSEARDALVEARETLKEAIDDVLNPPEEPEEPAEEPEEPSEEPEEPAEEPEEPAEGPEEPAEEPEEPAEEPEEPAEEPEEPAEEPAGPITSYTSGDSPDDYNITVVFEGTWPEEYQDAFITAAELLSDIILDDVPDTMFRGELIDDIVITAELFTEAVGGTLGWAGVDGVRSESDGGLPVSGFMGFDTADIDSMIANGTWVDVVVHEMLHTLGFGTISAWDDLTETTSDGTLRFTGENAMAAYADYVLENDIDDEFYYLGVPVEEEGGSGTAGAHWDEEILQDELMTGYISSSGAELSDITIAALEDMGYETIWEMPSGDAAIA